MKKNYALLFIIFALFTQMNGYSEDCQQIPTLSVTGTASLYKTPDQLSMIIGVVTEAKDSGQALNLNNEKMQKVVGALKELGLDKTQMQTGQFSILPIYTQRPKNAEDNWSPKIAMYRVTNQIRVKTANLALSAKLIEKATDAGANSIDQISFSLENPQMWKHEAIAEASKNAIEDAKNLALSTDVQLLRIFQIQLNDASIRPPPIRSAMMLTAKDAAFRGSTPIESGTIEINAHVTLTYEIQN